MNEQAADAVNFANVKNLGELHSLTAGFSGQDQLAQQRRVQAMADSVLGNAMNAAQANAANATVIGTQIMQNGAMLAQASMVRAFRLMTDTSAEEAVAFTKQIGADLASEVKNIGGSLAAIQQFAKEAQTTAPQTGTGGAFGSDAGSALLQQIANTQALLVNGLSELSAAIASLKKE